MINRALLKGIIIAAIIVSIVVYDRFLKYPLHAACRYGCTRIARLLLVCGAKINRVDDEDETPLLHAIHAGHINTIELLIKQGADVNQSSNVANADQEIEAVTPLLIAGYQDRLDIAELLIAYGQDFRTNIDNFRW